MCNGNSTWSIRGRKVIKKRIPYGKVVIIVPDVNDERTKAYYQGLLGLQQKK